MFIPQNTAQTGLSLLEQLVSKALAFTTVPPVGAPHTLEAAIMPASVPADLINDIRQGTLSTTTLDHVKPAIILGDNSAGADFKAFGELIAGILAAQGDIQDRGAIAIDLVAAPGVATGAAATLQSLAVLLNKGLLEGTPSLSGELVTLSSALPDEVWNLVFSHLNAQQSGATQVSLTEAAFDGLPPTGGVLLDVESAITLVGVGAGVLDAVPL